MNPNWLPLALLSINLLLAFNCNATPSADLRNQVDGDHADKDPNSGKLSDLLKLEQRAEQPEVESHGSMDKDADAKLESIYVRLFKSDKPMQVAHVGDSLTEAVELYESLSSCQHDCRAKYINHKRVSFLEELRKNLVCESEAYLKNFERLLELDTFDSLHEYLEHLKRRYMQKCIGELEELIETEKANKVPAALSSLKLLLNQQQPLYLSIKGKPLEQAIVGYLASTHHELEDEEADRHALQEQIQQVFETELATPCREVDARLAPLLTRYDAIMQFNVGENQFFKPIEGSEPHNWIESGKICSSILNKIQVQSLYKLWLDSRYNFDQLEKDIFSQVENNTPSDQELLKKVKIASVLAEVDPGKSSFLRTNTRLLNILQEQSDEICDFSQLKQVLKDYQHSPDLSRLLKSVAKDRYSACSNRLGFLFKQIYANIPSSKELDQGLDDLEVLKLTLVNEVRLPEGATIPAEGLAKSVARFLANKKLAGKVLKGSGSSGKALTPKQRAYKLLESLFESTCQKVTSEFGPLAQPVRQLHELNTLGIGDHLETYYLDWLTKIDICMHLSGNELDFEILVNELETIVENYPQYMAATRENSGFGSRIKKWIH